MKIVICVKPINTNTVKFSEENEIIINPYDVYCLSEAKVVKKETNAEIIVLMMTRENQRIAAEVNSFGADRIIFLSDIAFAGSDTYATSYILSMAIQKIGNVDYVFCGNIAIDGETGQVGPQIATWLDFSCIYNVEKINCENGFLHADTSCGNQVDIYKLHNNSVVIFNKCIIGEVVLSLVQMRKMTTVKYECWNREYLEIEEKDCGLKGSKTTVKNVKSYMSINNRDGIQINWNDEIERDRIFSVIREV